MVQGRDRGAILASIARRLIWFCRQHRIPCLKTAAFGASGAGKGLLSILAEWYLVGRKNVEQARMGHRLSKIYTRTGDGGTTGLGDGERINKNHARVAAMGDVDELNSTIGMLIAELSDESLRDLLSLIQHDLFDLGGELSIPGSGLLPANAVTRLESTIDEYNEPLPPLKEFILPGGSRAAANCHLARAMCRRAERSLVGLAEISDVKEQTMQYVNRLSDLLFVLARTISRLDGGEEVTWDRQRFST